MTTVVIERELLEQVIKAIDRCFVPRIDELRAALAAPATAPEFNPDWAQMIHYPDCWDTAAYPELRDAIHEVLAWSGCSVCNPATAPDEQVRKDAERYRWLRHESLRLSFSAELVSLLVANQSELDGAMEKEA